MDSERLQSGQDYEERIREAVRKCSAFISIISSATERSSESWIHLERNWAAQTMESMPRGQAFYIPVVIEAGIAPPRNEPRHAQSLEVNYLPGGRPDLQFVDQIHRLWKAAVEQTLQTRNRRPNDDSKIPRTISIFISSPGNVAEERDAAKQVIKLLQNHYGSRVHLVPLLWEDMPLSASGSFKQGIDVLIRTPSGIDIAIFILWSRLGSQLGSPTRPDGTPYRSGTEREFEMMLAAWKAKGESPAILAYVRKDDEAFNERLRVSPEKTVSQMLEQRKLVDQFVLEKSQDSEGIFIGAWHSYKVPADFAERCEAHH